MKKITIEVPEGKTAKWEGDSIIFVDDNVMGRVKTFKDACNELGEDHKFVIEYLNALRFSLSADLHAYLRLRIIVAALNEGWEPTFKNKEIRYYPWFRITRTSLGKNIVYFDANSDSAFQNACAGAGACLAFKNEELVKYAGIQFINLYKEFLLKL